MFSNSYANERAEAIPLKVGSCSSFLFFPSFKRGVVCSESHIVFTYLFFSFCVFQVPQEMMSRRQTAKTMENPRENLVEKSKQREENWKVSEEDQRKKRRDRFQTKRKEFDQYLNTAVVWNVKFADEKKSTVLLASPSLEWLRAQKITELQNFFEKTAEDIFEIRPPTEILQRWLTEQYSVPLVERKSPTDAIIPAPTSLDQNSAVCIEIPRHYPTTCYISWGQRRKPSLNTADIFNKYVSKAIPILEKTEKNATTPNPLAPAALKALLHIERIVKRIYNREKWISSDIVKEWSELVEQKIVPYFKSIVKPLLENFCKLLIAKASEIAAELEEYSKKQTRESIEQEKVTLTLTDTDCTLQYESDTLKVKKSCHDKLKTLFSLSTMKDEFFPNAFYCALRRHHTLFGGEASGFQAAAPPSAFDFVASSENFGVSQETFASPFNCYLSHYCSAFPDVDSAFGSCGSFFDFEPLEGSFQLGTPNVYEVMIKAAKRVEYLLEKATGPMSFVMFVPDWKDAEFIDIYSKSKYLQGEFLQKGNEYCYIGGTFHLVDSKEDRFFVAPFGNRIFVLQNELGKKTWPTTPKKLELLSKVFTDSKELGSSKA
jgi:hypothetical protein